MRMLRRSNINMRNMVIGLSPDYNYPGTLRAWQANNTFYASNYGACFLTRAIMRLFDADYISDFSDLDGLKSTYDTCVLALSTHVHQYRDVSYYADIVEKLNLKTIILSLGIQDQVNLERDIPLAHHSMIRLLGLVADRSKFIGVRGYYTAEALRKLGFKNVLPVGCPSFSWVGEDDLFISKRNVKANASAMVYHQTVAPYALHLMQHVKILGQDFLDQAIFTQDIQSDEELIKRQCELYRQYEGSRDILKAIEANGIFPQSFDQWFDTIKKSDFVFGPRLHGCIAALVNRVPALLVSRDLRTQELSEYYRIPTISYNDIKNMSEQDLIDIADYSGFNATFGERYKSFYDFLEANGLMHKLKKPREMTNAPTFV
jgi:hypothetical protein